MAKDFSSITDQPSAFSSVLKYLGRPAYAFRDLLKGNVEGAVRQGADILGDTVDAFLPGDMVSEISRPEDYAEASDLFGGMKPGLAKTAVDVVGGIATDPLTYFGAGLFTGAAKGIATGINAAKAAPVIGKVVTAAEKPVAEAWLGLKNMTGNLNVAEPFRQSLQAGTEAQQGSQAAMTAASRAALAGTLPEDQEALGAVLHGFTKTPEGYQVLTPSIPNTPAAIQTEAALKRMGLPGVEGQPLTAGEAFLQVKKPDVARPIDPLSKDLGVKGVAVPPLAGDVLEQVTKDPNRMWDQVFNPQYADNAASRALEAFPKLPTEARFQNGIDVANNALGVPGLSVPFRSLLPDKALGPLPTAPLEHLSLGEQMAASKATVPVQGAIPDTVSGMLGQTPIERVARPGIDLVKSPGEAAMYAGGMSSKVPEFTHVPADEMERALFTNRGKIDDVQAQAEKNLQALNLPPETADRLRKVLPELIANKQKAFEERVTKGVMNPQIGTDLKSEAALYANRVYEDTDPLSNVFKGGSGSSAKMRDLITPESATEFLNKNPNLSVEMGAAKLEGIYNQQQARLLGKAAFANKLIEPYAASAEKKLADAGQSVEKWTMLPDADKLKVAGLLPEEAAALEARGQSLFSMGESGSLTKGVNTILDAVKKTDPESAMALDSFWNGLPVRKGAWAALASVNNLFKSAATAGAFIPRINFSVRNVTSGLAQVLANPESRSQWPKYAKQAAGMITGAVDDGIEKLTGGRVGANQFKQIDDALANSRGSLDAAVASLPDGSMKEALRHGVITDGFANQELLANEIAQHGWKKKYADIRDWPAAIAQGSEKRMRFALFDGLLSDGIAPAKAAQIVKDSMYDYAVTSSTNRAARDLLPFFAFSAKAIPQMAKALKEHPFLIPAVRPLYDAAPGAILPEYLQNQMNIPVGTDADGKPSYLTSFGLPIDALAQIPNPSDSIQSFGRQLRQDVVGASNPLLKTAYGAITGTDPMFGSNFMSFDKAPAIAQALGADERSHTARVYNALAGTGVIQPLVSSVAVLNNIVDPSKTTPVALLNGLTGVQVKSVDEQRALKQLIETYLKENPEVQSSLNFYQNSQDPETQDAIKELGRIKQALRSERKPAVR